jgi:peptidoglycan/xylan/chitin deacetylase (PgdA/CDA1 family)
VAKALQFHRITPEFQWCGTWNRPDQFRKFLDMLCSDGITVGLPGDGSDIVITFDDGDKTIYEYAFPLLKEYGMKALVFLVTDFVDKQNVWDVSITGKRAVHLAWDEIREMHSYGIEFGSHTMTHRNLTRLDPAGMRKELAGSKMTIEEKLGLCRCVSYPFNRVDRTVLMMTAQCGYEFGFGGDGSHALLLKKEAVYITDTPRSFGIKISETPRSWYVYERFVQKVINYFTITTMLTRRA